MPRPANSEWQVLDLSTDPTPGDPDDIERLATRYATLSADAGEARDLLAGNSAIAGGQGETMREFNSRLGALPKHLALTAGSYKTASDALRQYAGTLRDCQQRADQALNEGRDLRATLDAQ